MAAFWPIVEERARRGPRGPFVRRSSVVMTTIMLLAFGVMFAAAGSALRPLAEDAESAKLVRRMLEARGDLVPDSPVRLSRLKASEQRLAAEGFGLVLCFAPSTAVKNRPGALRAVAIRAAHEALSRYRGAGIEWVEVNFQIGAASGLEDRFRTLLPVRDGGLLGEPDPTPPVRLGSGTDGGAKDAAKTGAPRGRPAPRPPPGPVPRPRSGAR